MADETLYQVELSGGETLSLRPLSPYARLAFIEKAAQLFPMPDPTPFQQIVPNTPAGVTVMTPPEDDPRYREMADEVNVRRANYVNNAIITASVVDIEGGQEAAIQRHAEQLDTIRRLGAVPEDYSEWQATLLLCVIRSREEVSQLINLATSKFPLDDKERGEAVKIFRRNLESPPNRGHSRKAGASGAATAVG